jgi:uroporphyrinogen decarboxylase
MYANRQSTADMKGEHMAEFTGKDRVRAAFKRTYADYVPAYPMAGAFVAQLCDMTIADYLTSTDNIVKGQMASYETFHPDNVVVIPDLLMEAEALGTELIFPDDAICQAEKRFLEDKGRMVDLKLPDPTTAGRIPMYLEACRHVVDRVKDSSVSSSLSGPWVMAVGLRGLQELIYDTVDDPAFVHSLMRKTTDFAKMVGDLVIEIGVGLSYSEAAASCSVISPKIYREFIQPYETEIVRYFTEKRKSATFHICGFIDPTMADAVATGSPGISIDGPSSLAKMVEATDNKRKTVIIGNVPTTLFEMGTKDEMFAAVKECIDTAAAGSGYILAPGCELPPTASIDSVLWFMEAAREFGRYPQS